MEYIRVNNLVSLTNKLQEKKEGVGGTYEIKDIRAISVKFNVWTLFRF